MKEMVMIDLIQFGIGGETTEGLLKRMPVELEARNSADGNLFL
jgi:hypothetical protein